VKSNSGRFDNSMRAPATKSDEGLAKRRLANPSRLLCGICAGAARQALLLDLGERDHCSLRRRLHLGVGSASCAARDPSPRARELPPGPCSEPRSAGSHGRACPPGRPRCTGRPRPSESPDRLPLAWNTNGDSAGVPSGVGYSRASHHRSISPPSPPSSGGMLSSASWEPPELSVRRRQTHD
jgi:hypothetical protein